MPICKAGKGGGALQSAPDLVLVAADVGTQPQTTEETLSSLWYTPPDEPIPNKGVHHIPSIEDTRRNVNMQETHSAWYPWHPMESPSQKNFQVPTQAPNQSRGHRRRRRVWHAATLGGEQRLTTTVNRGQIVKN